MNGDYVLTVHCSFGRERKTFEIWLTLFTRLFLDDDSDAISFGWSKSKQSTQRRLRDCIIHWRPQQFRNERKSGYALDICTWDDEGYGLLAKKRLHRSTTECLLLFPWTNKNRMSNARIRLGNQNDFLLLVTFSDLYQITVLNTLVFSKHIDLLIYRAPSIISRLDFNQHCSQTMDTEIGYIFCAWYCWHDFGIHTEFSRSMTCSSRDQIDLVVEDGKNTMNSKLHSGRKAKQTCFFHLHPVCLI